MKNFCQIKANTIDEVKSCNDKIDSAIKEKFTLAKERNPQRVCYVYQTRLALNPSLHWAIRLKEALDVKFYWKNTEKI